MSELFEKAKELYQLKNPCGNIIEADESRSELNVIGYYRLKSSEGETLLRIKAECIDEELNRLKQKHERNSIGNAQQEALARMTEHLSGGLKLEVIGGFWDKSCMLNNGKIYLYVSVWDGGDLGINHVLEASEFDLEIVTEENKKVAGRVLKGALWGAGLGLLSGGLGFLGAAGV